MDNVFIQALIISFVVQGVVTYLKLPLIHNPSIVKWMVKRGLAHEDVDGTGMSLWWIPYLTFILGMIFSFAFGLDFVTSYVPKAAPWAALLMTALIIGTGSNGINDFIQKVLQWH